MNIIDRSAEPTQAHVPMVERIVMYVPVLMVAGIIGSEVAGLHFVFWPLYFANSWLLRALCTIPMYMGIVLLSWSWIKCIICDPGMIEDNGSLSSEQVAEIKKESNHYNRRITAIRKYLSVNQEAYTKHHKKLYDEFPAEMKKMEDIYKRCSHMSLRQEMQNAMLENQEQTTFCVKCNIIRPPRAHHCKTCKRCYLRMDHHCPWVGNCVGEKNHKFFIQFTGYAGSTQLFCWLQEFVAYFFTDFPAVSTFQDTVINVNMWTMLVLGSAIFFQFTYQFKNAYKSITTVEDMLPGMDKEDINPFYVSKMANLEQVFGPFSWKNWLLPINGSRIKSNKKGLRSEYSHDKYPIDETDELGSIVKEI